MQKKKKKKKTQSQHETHCLDLCISRRVRFMRNKSPVFLQKALENIAIVCIST